MSRHKKAERTRTERRREERRRQKLAPAATTSAPGRRWLAWLVLPLLLGGAAAKVWWPREVPVHGFRVVQRLPHDPGAFTQGLLVHDGFLYESTGKRGKSELRKVQPETGEIVERRSLPDTVFGEGLALVDDRFYQLTWEAGQAHVWDRDTLESRGVIEYEGEGWGLTYDGEHLVMSDGSDRLRFLDPATFETVRSLPVTFDGQPLEKLNELEWVHGQVWANLWKSDRIACIDPESGEVRAWVDLGGLHPKRIDPDAVLNGIAWDPQDEKLYVGGKWWDRVYEIEVLE